MTLDETLLELYDQVRELSRRVSALEQKVEELEKREMPDNKTAGAS